MDEVRNELSKEEIEDMDSICEYCGKAYTEPGQTICPECYKNINTKTN